MDRRFRWMYCLASILVGGAIYLAWFAAVQAKPDVSPIYVNQAASGANDGSSWEDAYTTLQAALDQAAAGDEIWVAEGTYLPSLRSNPDVARSATFTLKPGVGLYGGFNGSEMDRELRNWVWNPTILSGDLEGDDITGAVLQDSFVVSDVINSYLNQNGENAFHVVNADGVPLTETAVLDGFFITGGSAENHYGGGMILSGASPTLRNLHFSGNFAYWMGGGLAMFWSNHPKIDHVTFSGNGVFGPNLEGGGGGMAIAGYSYPTLSDLTFLDNSAGRFGGGGLYCENKSIVTLDGALFKGNIATNDHQINPDLAGGGGMRTSDCGVQIFNTVFQDNHSVGLLLPDSVYIDVREENFGDGGGMLLEKGLGVGTYHNVIQDTVFLSNTAAHGGGLLIEDDITPYDLERVTFQSNTAFSHSGGLAGGGILTVKESLFSNNRSPQVGGLRATLGARILNSRFIGNTTYDPKPDENTFYTGAAGMYILDGSAEGCLFKNNYFEPAYGSSLVFGEAIQTAGVVNLANMTIDGQIGVFHNTSVHAVNSIITEIDFGHPYWSWPGYLSLDNSIVGTLWCSTGCTYGWTDGGGNLFGIDPLYVDADYRLQSTSPAIDSGLNSAVTLPTDLDGNQRIKNDTVDMGAYEYGDVTLQVARAGSGSVSSDPAGIDCGSDCQESYPYVYPLSEPISLTAHPDPGWSFAGWSGELVSTDNPLSLAIQHDTALTATFNQDDYLLNVTIVGTGVVEREPNLGFFHYGDVVTLTASTTPGFSFLGWSGDLVSSANPLTLTIYGNTNLMATFSRDEYLLDVGVLGSGAVTRLPDQPSYHYSDTVRLSAAPDPGWTFAGWSGDIASTQNPLTLTMTSAVALTATFTQDEYALDITKVGNGTTGRTPDQPSYHYSDTVRLSAAPDPGWSFAGWSGDLLTTTNPLTLTILGSTALTATFTQDEYHLQVGVNGLGSVGRDPDQLIYHYGDVVNLTATAEQGWLFQGWSGDFASTQNPLTVTIDSNLNLTARFTTFPVYLPLTARNAGTTLSDLPAALPDWWQILLRSWSWR